MTIVIPKPGLVDQMLRLLGKQRGVTLQKEATGPSDTQNYFAPKKESVMKAVLRPNREALPAGMADIFTFQYKETIEEEEPGAQPWMTFTPFRFILQKIPMLISNRRSVS
jgi:hypothetical protein